MIHVLIPAHNNKDEVLDLLACLSGQTYREFTTVLVDDGSTDGTAQEVAARFPSVVVLKADGNQWWTGANVLGVDHILARAAARDFILLINNDLVVEPDYVEELVAAHRVFGNRTIVGSLLVDWNDRRWAESGIRFDERLKLRVNRDRTLIDGTDFDHDVDVLPGRGTLVPVEAFRTIGNFNLKRLPHYGADYEFTMRARRAGYRLVVAHKAKVFAKLNITGLRPPTRKLLSVRECVALLCSKRSTCNLRYHMTYVWLCSEPGQRVRNTVRSGTDILQNTVCKMWIVYPFYSAARRLARRGRALLRRFKLDAARRSVFKS